jgi:uncharacterized sporulation protein YeaH/YhbH (DUF444 family)
MKLVRFHDSRSNAFFLYFQNQIYDLFRVMLVVPVFSFFQVVYSNTMLDRFRKLEEENFQAVLIERREDVWPSFKAFLSRDPATAGT